MLKSLQTGRAVAALMVVLYHLNSTIFGDPKYWPNEIWVGFNVGYAGVHFFFVLSGFIILWAHAHQIGDSDEFRSYVVKRISRIYPPYWAALALVVPIYFLFPGSGAGYETHPFNIITSIVLWPTPENPVLPVAWTLRHELLFYSIFALLFFSKKAGISLLVAWMLGCCIAAISGPLPWPTIFVLNPLNLLFAFGMICAVVARRTKQLFSGSTLIVGIVWFVATAYLNLNFGTSAQFNDISYGLASAAIVLGLVGLEQNDRFSAPALFNELGNASYSIYLTHYPILSVLAKIWFSLKLNQLPDLLSFALILVITIVAGWLFHRIIERPLLRSISRQIPRSTKRPSHGGLN